MAPFERHWLKTAIHAWGPLVLIGLAFMIPVSNYLQNLWDSGFYGHLPLVLIVVAGLLWFRWEGVRVPGIWASTFATVLLALGFVLLLGSAVRQSPWIGYLGALVTSGAVLLRVCPASIREWAPAWLLLWLLVRFPMNLDQSLSLELQGYASRAGSLLLDFVGVNHLRSGNVLEIPGMKFAVEEACSGIRSLFVLMGAAAVWAVLMRRNWLHVGLLIVSAVGWASAANAFRISGVVVTASRFGIELSTGWRHEVWSLIWFAIAFALVLSTDRLLWFLFSPLQIEDEDLLAYDPGGFIAKSEAQTGSQGESDESGEFDAVPTGGAFRSWIIAGMFGGIGLLAIGQGRAEFQATPVAPLGASSFDEETLPAELAGWTRKKFEFLKRGAGDTNGEYSATWRFERAGAEAVVSLDFPFVDWHQLSECYRGRGCEMLEWRRESAASSSPDCAVASLSLENGRPATLYYAEWDEAGTIIEPPITERASLSRFVSDVKQRLGFGDKKTVNRSVYQLQALSQRPSPAVAAGMRREDAESLRELFAGSQRVLRELTTTSAGGAP